MECVGMIFEFGLNVDEDLLSFRYGMFVNHFPGTGFLIAVESVL